MVSLDLDQEPKVCEDLEEFGTTTWPQVLLLEGVQWMQYVPKCEKGLVTVINWDTDVFVSLKGDELQQLQIWSPQQQLTHSNALPFQSFLRNWWHSYDLGANWTLSCCLSSWWWLLQAPMTDSWCCWVTRSSPVDAHSGSSGGGAPSWNPDWWNHSFRRLSCQWLGKVGWFSSSPSGWFWKIPQHWLPKLTNSDPHWIPQSAA